MIQSYAISSFRSRLYPWFVVACIVALFLIGWSETGAQDLLSPNAAPDHGGAALGIGFAPDPLPISGILAGGNLDLTPIGMGQDCRGYVTAQPDFRINITYPFGFLRFIFVSDSLLNDTALIVRSPGGTYRCNEDSFNVDNPALDFRDMAMGEYAIWVSTVAPNVVAQGTLYLTISEAITPSSTGLVMPFAAPVVTPTPGGVLLPTSVPGTTMDISEVPVHGVELLEHGFLPDPFWEVLVGGGALPVPPHDVLDPQNAAATLCAGYATSAPQLRLEWRGISTRLRFFFIPQTPAGADTALVVHGPNGWVCNQSFAPGFVDPLVEFINPDEGSYAIWVSAEAAPHQAVSGLLYVTEKLYYPTFVPEIAGAVVNQVIGLDAELAADQGWAEVTAAFSPDPVMIPMLAGGEVDVVAENPNLDARTGCEGYTDVSPDFSLTLLNEMPYLRMFAVSENAEDDTTLIIRAPDGRWYCNDDSYNGLHPTVNLVGLAAGEYQVWLGHYDGPERVPVTLYISQDRNLSPQRFLRDGF